MRDTRIDILRFIGLAMIIFAHVDPPALLFQLRNFDVPLMVLVSGMSFFLSYTPHVSYSDYVWQRVRRLVFPVWVFLTLYFLAQYVLMPDAPDLNFGTVFGSYALMNGIGYVWVIRVFLLIALLSPFLYRVNKSVKEDKKYFLMLGCLYLLYETLRYVVLSSGKGASFH